MIPTSARGRALNRKLEMGRKRKKTGENEASEPNPFGVKKPPKKKKKKKRKKKKKVQQRRAWQGGMANV